MKRERNDLKAGVFILLSIGLIVGVVIAIKGVGRMLEPSQDAVVTFTLNDDIGGLRAGGDVRVGGLKVGVVREIEIVQRDAQPPHIVVRCSVPARIKVHKDARVRVQDTLTGSSWLNFDSLGTPGAPLLAANDTLVGRPSAMTTLLASAGEIAPDVRDTVRDVRTVTLPKVNDTVDGYKVVAMHVAALVKHVRSKIDPMVERYYALADTGKDAAAQIRDVFGESKGDFKTTMANISAATGTVKDKLPPIMDKVDGTLVKVQTAVDGANVALEDVKKTATNLKDVSASARSVIVGNRSKIDGMIASLKTTGDNLKYASAEIRRSPWRLLYKPAPGEVANLNLYDSARQFAEGANDLNDAAAALRDALQDPDATPDHVQTLVERLDKSFANFNAIEQVLWEQVK
jgi:phospholipid/cholesterol/gamma-HCH transport system substrate-binding protein